jgi:ribosomal-protein-alanine N-acetyltransferase
MNADPQVMEHLPPLLTSNESDAMIDRLEAGFEQRGFGRWALEVAKTGQFIGFTGLSVPPFKAHFTPAVEIGWRLMRSSWGYGYATEAARRVLSFAFAECDLAEVVSFTTHANLRSQMVMKRIGMTNDPADGFDHPLLGRNVLWRMTAERWRDQPNR